MRLCGENMNLKKIVSGGQTGVDRAALDAALALGIAIGGWCPKGRRAEDGIIPARYPLTETTSDDYKERTELNVRDSDATLIIKQGWTTPGTSLTIRLTGKHRRPCRIINLEDGFDTDTLVKWLEPYSVVNVAGPRESSVPGIGNRAYKVLLEILGATVVTD